MNREELTPHVEELKRVLNNSVDDKTILDMLSKFVNEFHLGIDDAKRGVIRKLGGESTGYVDTAKRASASGFVTAEAVVKKVADLEGTEMSVDIIARAVYVENKQITVKGNPKDIVSGLIGDETGTVSFTDWEGKAQLEKGRTYRFRNCYCKKWNDRVQVNVGNRGSIEPADDVKIDMPERNYNMSSSEMKIGEIKEGVGNVTVTGRILSTEVRQITVKEQPKTVYSGIIADDSGKIQYSAWNDFQLKEGETIRVENAYIRAWKGIPQLNLGERCTVSRVDGLSFDEVKIAGPSEKTVSDIVKNGGGLDITVRGTVVDVKAGSGLIKRCPECNRSILNDECLTHGTVVPVPDLRLKAIVDDGTGAIAATINREFTEKITGVTLQMASELAKARGNDIVMSELAKKILIKRVKISGNVMSDDYGPTMIVKSAELDTVDVNDKAKKLLKDVEAVL